MGSLSPKMLAAFLKQPTFRDNFQNKILEIIEPELHKILEKIEVDHPKWRSSRFVQVNKSSKSIKYGHANAESDTLENGTKEQQVTGTYVQYVKSHSRQSKNNKTTIRQHKRTYRGYKPIQLPNGEWRMVSRIPERKGKKILEKLVDSELWADGKIADIVSTKLDGLSLDSRGN